MNMWFMETSRRNGKDNLVFHIAMWLVTENTVTGKSWQKKRRFFKHGKGDRQGQTCLTRTAEKVLALLGKPCLVVFCHNFIIALCFILFLISVFICVLQNEMVLIFHPRLVGMELSCYYQADTRYCSCSHYKELWGFSFSTSHCVVLKSLQSLLGNTHLSASVCCKLLRLTFQN